MMCVSTKRLATKDAHNQPVLHGWQDECPQRTGIVILTNQNYKIFVVEDHPSQNSQGTVVAEERKQHGIRTSAKS